MESETILILMLLMGGVFLLLLIAIILWTHHSHPVEANSAEANVCPQCGRTHSSQENYCPGCGQPLQAKTAPSRRNLSFLWSIGMLALIAVAIWLWAANRPSASSRRYPPYQSIGYTQQQSPENRIRYGILDLQLGGAAAEQQYRRSLSETEEIERAVSLWNNGIRVLNIYQFNAIQFPEGSWEIVYGGTERIVHCEDVVLSSDVAPDGSIEAQIRYILADAQLGNVIEYYRQYTDQSQAIAEAIRRWDAGVRVANPERFERQIIFSAGWKVVYWENGQLINGMDVVLTSDATASLPPTPTTPPQPTATQPILSDEDRIRYILTDIQFGLLEYYRSFADDPIVAEALCRWDSGVRVTNIEDFERKIILDQWQIVYANSETAIDGSTVQLSSSITECLAQQECVSSIPAQEQMVLTTGLEEPIYAWLYSAPSFSAPLTNGMDYGPYSYDVEPGTPLFVREGPVCAEGVVWWRVQHYFNASIQGWTYEAHNELVSLYSCEEKIYCISLIGEAGPPDGGYNP